MVVMVAFAAVVAVSTMSTVSAVGAAVGLSAPDEGDVDLDPEVDEVAEDDVVSPMSNEPSRYMY